MDERANHLKLNEYLRQVTGVRDIEALGRQALSFPTYRDYQAACAMFPGMKSLDPHEKTKATLEFINHPFSMPYRVRERV